MNLSSSTRTLLERTRNLVARSWTHGYLYRRNDETGKPEYCLMGAVLRSSGVTKEQMTESGWLPDKPSKKSKIQKILEWSQFPDEAKVAMKALAIVILEEAEENWDRERGYDEGDTGLRPFSYLSDYWSQYRASVERYGGTPEEYLTANPEEIPNIIVEHNDCILRGKADAKALVLKALND